MLLLVIVSMEPVPLWPCAVYALFLDCDMTALKAKDVPELLDM